MTLRELLIRVGVTGEATEDLNRIDRATDKVKRGFSGLSALLTTLFAGGALKKLVDVADEMQNLQAQVGNATNNMAEANAHFNELAQHANDTRQSVDAYVGSWAKMNQGITSFGGTAEDTTKFMDTLSAAFTSNGTAAESSSAALFQLGQTMQSGVVQGEEMNSFLDAQGTLAREVMVEIAGTVPAYKKMQAAGKVTAKMLMDAVNKQYPKYMAQLKAMPMTMSSVWTIVTNDIKKAINNVNNDMTIIPRMAKTVMGWWTKLKTGASEFVGQLGGLSKALTHLKDVLKPLGAALGVLAGLKALALLTTPIGMTLALAAAIGVLYDDFMTWKRGGESLIDWSEWEPAINQAMAGIDWIISKFKELTGVKSDTEAVFAGIATAIAVAFGLKTTGYIIAITKLVRTLGTVAGGTLGKFAALVSTVTALSEIYDKYIDQTKDENGNPRPLAAGGWAVKDTLFGNGSDYVADKWQSLKDWWHGTDAGKGNWKGTTEPAGVPLAPGVKQGGSVVNNVQAPTTVNNNITVNAAPGQSPQDVGMAVQQQINQRMPGGFDPHSLMMNGGGK